MSPHRPLEAIKQQIALTCHAEATNALCNELIAAVRAERPSSVHLDRALSLARQATNGWAVYAKRACEHDDIARLHRELDAIEASLAPQTPEALPMLADPVSLAPVEGRPEAKKAHDAVKFIRLLLSDCHGTDDHSWSKCERCLAVHHVDSRQKFAVALLSSLPAYIERLEVNAIALTKAIQSNAVTAINALGRVAELSEEVSRLTLEYRVHMRNITEGEAARKAEVATLKAKVKALEGVLRQVRKLRGQYPDFHLVVPRFADALAAIIDNAILPGRATPLIPSEGATMSQILKTFADHMIANKTTWWVILECGHWYHWPGDHEPRADRDFPCLTCEPPITVVRPDPVKEQTNG